MLSVHKLVRNASSCLTDCVSEVPGSRPTIELATAYMSWAEYFLSSYHQNAEKAHQKLATAHVLLKDLLNIYYEWYQAPTYETERLEAIVNLIEDILCYLSPYDTTSEEFVIEEEYIELTELPEFCE